MIQKILSDFVMIPEVEAIQLVGSRAGKIFDELSDYNVVVYTTGKIEEKYRSSILMQYCSRMEIGENYDEYCDYAILKDTTPLVIVYRDLDAFVKKISSVVFDYEPLNGSSTCDWAEIENGKIMYDRNGKLKDAVAKLSFIYPPMMQIRVIDRNLRLLTESIPNVNSQIRTAMWRGDRVAIISLSSQFISFYIDIIYAVNRKMQPGRKRMIEEVRRQCRNLPKNFDMNLTTYLNNMFNPEVAVKALDDILEELQAYINKYKKI